MGLKLQPFHLERKSFSVQDWLKKWGWNGIFPVAQFLQQEIVKCFCPQPLRLLKEGILQCFYLYPTWGTEASCPIFPSSLLSFTFWDETKLEQRRKNIKDLNCICNLCQKCFSPRVIFPVLAPFVFTSKLLWKWNERKKNGI